MTESGPVIEQDPFGTIKSDRAPGILTPEEVNRLHAQSDRDRSPLAQHHTCGIHRNQASPGDHNHSGVTSRKIGTGMNLTVDTGVSTAADLANLLVMLHKVIDFDEV